MIDFFEYVVAELKGKRLSRTNAVDLVRQFSTRSFESTTSPILHPLLHRNTSDISQQRYTTVLRGDEGFLADHQLCVLGSPAQRILPGSVYLELARAAIENASPHSASTRGQLQLQNVIWMQPFVALGKREISIGLGESGDGQIDYEIYSEASDQKIVHCVGSASWTAQKLPARFDIEHFEKQLAGNPVRVESMYERFLRAGMIYGPGFQVITGMSRGDGHVLAHLRLPAAVSGDQTSYVLHPNLIDGALQTCQALAGKAAEEDDDPRLPYALDSIQIYAPCQPEMLAWSRFAPDSATAGDTVKVDIDLLDKRGNICASLRGFSYRAAKSDSTKESAQEVLETFVPVWNPTSAEPRLPVSDLDRVLLIGADETGLNWLQRSLTNAHHVTLPLPAGRDDIAAILREQIFDHLVWIAPSEQEGDSDLIEDQQAGVLTVFRITKALLSLGYGDRKLRWTLILRGTQPVSEYDEVKPTHAGVVGLIGSLAKEYPQWSLNLLDLSALTSVSASECLSMPSDARGNAFAYRKGEWFHQHFIPAVLSSAKEPIRYRQGGVYVVLGGAGGLGEIWTRMLIEQYKANVVWIGRRKKDSKIEARIDALSPLGPRPWYIQADASSLAELDRAARTIREKYPVIHGIVHAAIVLHDQTIARMEEASFTAGLSAKVDTSVNLDRIFGELDLDFFLFFSSVVSFVKSPAQSNYAAGSAFADSFALRLGQKRSYPVRIINWGYWGSVGAATSQAYNQHMKSMGVASIEPAEGMVCLQSLLSSALTQMAAIKMVGGRPVPFVHLLSSSGNSGTSSYAQLASSEIIHDVTGHVAANEENLREKGMAYLQKLVASTLKMRPEQIEPCRPLADYGLDSIVAGQLTLRLRKVFSGVTGVLLFEIKDVQGLVDYFLRNNRQELLAVLSVKAELPESLNLAVRKVQCATPVAGRRMPPFAPAKRSSTVYLGTTPSLLNQSSANDRSRVPFDVAIIGMSGRYPGAEDLEQLWVNLARGLNCITEIPEERWHWQDYFDPQRGKAGKMYTKWGGFLKDIDHFDPLFFKIAPQHAGLMDPQERVFLQSCYHAIEDAGYTPESLGPAEKVGVFVGVMNARYASQPAHFSIANRVSYLFNYQGPSMAVDTACSSSLTAVHLALESLYAGESTCTIAGGVNLIIDAKHYLQLTDLTMLSSGNQCRAFGDSADGTVDSEGVGVVILKPVQQAERDGDHIYGVLKGSAINAGGRTNGYTVPNPQAQSWLVARALERGSVPAGHITYIEAHGTGTPLGDPIEIAGLTSAFAKTTSRKQFCSIGSLKSNIGHCESAAGIAGLTKVLLQLKHEQLAPSLHAEVPNSEIDFSRTPFKVQTVLEPWRRSSLDVDGVVREIPRTAGVSSFGAGGANAHVIVQEYRPAQSPVSGAREQNGQAVIVLSAASDAQLMQKAADLLLFIHSSRQNQGASTQTLDLMRIAHTLQVGRKAMEERLGFVAESIDTLAEALRRLASDDRIAKDIYRGSARSGQAGMSVFLNDPDLQATVDGWLAQGKTSKLLEGWVKGLEVDWSKLYGEAPPRRMSLPLYPFAKQRYWIQSVPELMTRHQAAGEVALHSVVHRNTSDLDEQRFTSTFTGAELFLAHHQVKFEGQVAQRVLPAVVYLEMARVALELGWRGVRESGEGIELSNLAWAQPFVVDRERQLHIALWSKSEEEVEFEIYSQTVDHETVHCQGLGIRSQSEGPSKIDIGLLKVELGASELEPGDLYAAWQRMGALHGPAFQVITGLYRGDRQVLAKLHLPSAWTDTTGMYGLHPALMDGALQAAIGLSQSLGENTARVPFALASLQVFAPCHAEMTAWVRVASSPSSGDDLTLDIDLLDESGTICVQMRGLSSRAISNATAGLPEPELLPALLMASPEWHPESIQLEKTVVSHSERHIILCEMGTVDPEELADLLLYSQCLSLNHDEGNNMAERYCAYAVASFKRIQTIMRSKPEGKVLVQLVVGDRPEQTVLRGLAALLKTATLENPTISGQLVIAANGATAQELAVHLEEEAHCPSGEVVKYESNRRFILRWREMSAQQESPNMPFKNDCVYLITGGLGGLGIVFAREILKQAPKAKIVLTGRSPANERTQHLLSEMEMPGQVSYRSLDVSNFGQVQQLIADIEGEHGRLNGILHGAGILADNFILKKTSSEFTQVMLPKVAGAYNLDVATKGIGLDFFVLFSSVSGAAGNAGQADYASANAFMDELAVYRNGLVAAKERFGKTRSINWGAWKAGGMGCDPADRVVLEQATGMRPMQTANGIDGLYRALTLSCHQLLVAEGDLPRLRSALTQAGEEPPVVQTATLVPFGDIETDVLLQRTEAYLAREFSHLLQVPLHKIDTSAPLERYGIDSILAMKLTGKLEEVFGSLSKTLFFEYQTISALAAHLLKAHPATLRDRIGRQAEASEAIGKSNEVKVVASPSSARRRSRHAAADRAHGRDQIAIVGLAGRYPQADDIQEFWENLQAGRDCITEIPPDRWDHAPFYDADPNVPGKTYCKWGGFIRDVDKFDSMFFNISPREAALLDPQERLFLQTAWETIEDAGYSKAAMAGRRVGVFVGAMWGHYELFGAQSMAQGGAVIPSSSYASIANRVSYFFDFHGPSLAVDTMCSSSLTAMHLACEELRKGEIDAAIAGGVNLSIHPLKFFSLSQGKFGASDGRCRSFGHGGDGYVPGEGVGAVLLKPLSHALRDRDHIYGVVKASALNHGGKTNGYTVPNPVAQGELIADVLKKANMGPETLGYIETHGTGTSLGDPIEIAGLLRAFSNEKREVQICPIGSVKSNIGHLESAAGIAAITKALLQIRHKQLVPSLHADPPNANIDFKTSPFYVQTELAAWNHTAAHPRRVGVSSFGAGGSNAHLILEEHPGCTMSTPPTTASVEAFLLSARTLPALRRYAEKTVAYLGDPSAALGDIVFTSQVGRSPMSCRLVVLSSSTQELKAKLLGWISAQDRPDETAGEVDQEANGVYQGNVAEASHGMGKLIGGQAGKAFLGDLIASRDLEKLAKFWGLGIEIDWSLLDQAANRKRVSLPTYPFERERHWIQSDASLAVSHGHVATKKSVPSVPLDTSQIVERKYRLAYSPRWVRKALNNRTSSQPTDIPTILMLDTSNNLFRSLEAVLLLNGTKCSRILVTPGPSFTQISDNTYTVNVEREEDFSSLVESLSKRALLPATLLHHGDGAHDLGAETEIFNDLNTGLRAIFSLCKALLRAKHPTLNILSVSSRSDDAASPLRAAVTGFLRTLALENPRYRGKVVALHGQASQDPARVILEELDDADWTSDEISYRQATDQQEGIAIRHARELLPLPVGGARAAGLPFRFEGVYVITGGLGGLGLIVAEYLARTFRAKLVLVGRKLPGVPQQEAIKRLEKQGAEVFVVQADLSRAEDAARAMAETVQRFSVVHGIFHAAGQIRDGLILNKTKIEIDAVLAPKVHGTINLDLATRSHSLDFFLLFSSIAGLFGNPGQADYAFANHFLDSFAEYREKMRTAGKRTGRTLSINWPLWQQGGMQISSQDLERMASGTGLYPLPTEEAILYLEDFLCSDATQAVPLYGIPAKITAFVAGRAAHVQPLHASEFDAAALLAMTEDYLKLTIGSEIGLSPERIGANDRLESFGIDSIMIQRLNAALEKDLSDLSKTLLYEHETIRDVAQFLLRDRKDALTRLFTAADAIADPQLPSPTGPQPVPDRPRKPVAGDDTASIAIIGIHGDYPQSPNLDEFWQNLRAGKDLISSVPFTRWDSGNLYSPNPAAAVDGKIYCKWGGFLEGHDTFDASFFKIPTDEARLIDPQERLFLQSVWASIEDAGYTRDSLKKFHAKARSADVGVFVGVTTNTYNLWAPEESLRGNAICPSALPWSIANRVSYFFDFAGPSLPVDTACSSSLVAVHLACEALKHGDCQVAIAGGVNLYLHSAKYQSLCQRRMLALHGRTRSYGAGDDGFIPGEGIGSVVLKPLGKAIEDGDHIYAVIPASAYDHSGRSNGYATPNPNSQATLIRHTLDKAKIHPETIGYVEGHGTGTQLGDSLEVAALSQAFSASSAKKQFCAIGSVKANIGHSESAAGVAAIAKVILQMKHEQLAPSIHSEEPNPNIDFGNSPFYLQHDLSAWPSQPQSPRRALVNSFGAGGVNACLVLEQYRSDHFASVTQPELCLFLLSARDQERLREYVERILVHLRREPDTSLHDLCYTLQVGREAMEERIATVVSSPEQLTVRLGEWLEGNTSDYIHRGSKASSRSPVLCIQQQELTDVASAWVSGQQFDWEGHHSTVGNRPRRISAPNCPFARDRYWFVRSIVPSGTKVETSQLHPLLSYNSSTLRETSFISILSDDAFYARDHRVHGVGIFPGAGFLEIACMAGNIAGEHRVHSLSGIAWERPLNFAEGRRTVQTSLKQVGDSVEYVVSSLNVENEAVAHSEGRLHFSQDWAASPLDADPMDLKALKERCTHHERGELCYDNLKRHGIDYGPSFQSIQEIYVGGSFALAKLKIADHLRDDFGQYILHPSLIDGAFQTAGFLMGDFTTAVPHVPFALDRLDILHPVRQTCFAYCEFAAAADSRRPSISKFNLRLLNESGDVLVNFKGLAARAMPNIPTREQTAQSAM